MYPTAAKLNKASAAVAAAKVCCTGNKGVPLSVFTVAAGVAPGAPIPISLMRPDSKAATRAWEPWGSTEAPLPGRNGCDETDVPCRSMGSFASTMASLTTVKVSARKVSVKVKDAYWVMVAVDKVSLRYRPVGRGELRCDPLEDRSRVGAALRYRGATA